MILIKNLHLDSFARFLHVYRQMNLQGWAMLTRELFKVIIFSLLVFILVMAKVMAQTSDAPLTPEENTANTSSVEVSGQTNNKDKKALQAVNPTANQNVVSGTTYQFVTTFGTNTADQDSYRNKNSASYEVFLRKGLQKNRGLLVYLGYGQDLIDNENSGVSDAMVAYQMRALKKFSFGGNLGANINIDIPISEKSNRLNSKVTGVNVSALLMGSLSKLGLSKTNYFVNAGIKKNFHRYKQTLDDRNNVSHRARVLGVISQQIGESFNFSFLSLFDKNWSYQGTGRDLTYYHEESLGYAFKKYSLEIGHNNSGLLRNNEFGPSDNFRVFNEKSSTYFLRLSAFL